MGANRFMSPKEVNYNQTYVDQYVPLPFETMVAALDTKQKHYDANDAAIKGSLAALLKVDAYRGQAELRDARIKEYEDKARKVIDEYGGDLSLADKGVSALAQEIHTDMTRGPLANYQSNFNNALAYREAEAAKKEKEIGKGGITHDRFGRVISFSDQAFDQGVQSALESGDPFGQSSFNGLSAVGDQDVLSKVDKYVEGFKANGFEKAGWSLDGDGALIKKTSSGTEYVSEKEIQAAATEMINSDPSIQEMFNQDRMLGASEEEIASKKASAINAAMIKHGYAKNKYDISLQFVPEHLDGSSGSLKKKEDPYTYFGQGQAVTYNGDDHEQVLAELQNNESKLSQLKAEYASGNSSLDRDSYNAEVSRLENEIASQRNQTEVATKHYLNTPEGKEDWYGKSNFFGAEKLSDATRFRNAALMVYPEKYLSTEGQLIIKNLEKENLTGLQKEQRINSLISSGKLAAADGSGLDEASFMEKGVKELPLEKIKKESGLLAGFLQGSPKDDLYYFTQKLNTATRTVLDTNPFTSNPQEVHSLDPKSTAAKTNANLTEGMNRHGMGVTVMPIGRTQIDKNQWEIDNMNDVIETLGVEKGAVKSKLTVTTDVVGGTPRYQLTYYNDKNGKTFNVPAMVTGEQGTTSFSHVADGLIKENQGQSDPQRIAAYNTGITMKANLLFSSPTVDTPTMTNQLTFRADDRAGTNKFTEEVVLRNNMKVIVKSTKGVNGNVTYELLNSRKESIPGGRIIANSLQDLKNKTALILQ